jgi:transglutaminase superfamily protein
VSAGTVAAGRPGLSPATKAALVVEILAAYLRIRWFLWRFDLPATLRVVRSSDPREPARSPGPEAQELGKQLARAVTRTLGGLPFDSRCLMRSLVLVSLLARRGLPASLVIGVASEPQFTAHAWVESEEVALLPANGPSYQRLVRL